MERAIGAMREAIGVSHAIVVIHRDDVSRYEAIAARVAEQSPGFLLSLAFGGNTRQASVRAGLETLKEMAPDIVLIHDAARPFVSAALIGRAISAAREHGAAVPGILVCIGVSRVSIKATTSVRLGFTGRGEGMAAQAIATIELPRRDSDEHV